MNDNDVTQPSASQLRSTSATSSQFNGYTTTEFSLSTNLRQEEQVRDKWTKFSLSLSLPLSSFKLANKQNLSLMQCMITKSLIKTIG